MGILEVEYVVVCPAPQVQVFGTFDSQKIADFWLGAEHCLEGDPDGDMSMYLCESDVRLGDHSIVQVDVP